MTVRIEQLAGAGPLRDGRARGGGIVDVDSSPFRWPEPDSTKRRLQAKLYDDYHAFHRLVRAVVNPNLHEVMTALGQANQAVETFIQQRSSPYSTAEAAASSACAG